MKLIFLCIAIRQDQNAFHWLFYSSHPLAPPRSTPTAPSLKSCESIFDPYKLTDESVDPMINLEKNSFATLLSFYSQIVWLQISKNNERFARFVKILERGTEIIAL